MALFHSRTTSFALLPALSLLLFAVGCEGKLAPPRDSFVPADAGPAPATWVDKPFGEWPQLLLTNDAQFQNRTPLEGASAFLVQGAKGQVYGATARHLITPTGGVKPAVTVKSYDLTLEIWKVHPRTVPEQSTQFRKLAHAKLDDPYLDWLVLTIMPQGDPLAAQPLPLRAEPVEIGEELWLIGCPYSEERCTQNRYDCKVTARQGDRFRYDLNPPVDLRGFSGAPILDRQGRVVGVMTVWFEPKQQGDQFLEGGGEDATPIYKMLHASE